MKTARVRIWARPHASPHLRVAVVQPRSGGNRCSEFVREWTQRVLSEAEPPAAVALVAWWVDDDGLVSADPLCWSQHAALSVPMLPGMAAAFLTRQATIVQARGMIMDDLGYQPTDDSDPAA